MGVSIQFESHTVELWAIYTMEYDAQVLEYLDEPYTMELHYSGPSGRPTQARHTPDFLVIRRDGPLLKSGNTKTAARIDGNASGSVRT